MTFNKAKALRQAEKHVQQGKINAAIDDYTKIAEFDPDDLTVVNTLGDLLVRAGRVEEAIVNFSKIAESYRENGFTLKAIAMFKKISKLNPQNVDVSLKLASLYSQQGLLVEARQQYLQVADSHARSGKTQKALEVYQKIADLDPENTAVRIKLAETYMRENMRDQAHDAYVAAGLELIRKNRVDQGLEACLQALAIDPESKSALTAVSEAYIQRGEAARAIDLLKDAFDKNPGDVEMITILGRTYLSAGMMDEAESTFMSLVQLDKSRYEYVLDLGRTFATAGELDRAAEQLDACVDILISRREEDKAIDFLHGLLERNVNHVPSLVRLADIYQRIREDHNLIRTLEALVEAAVRAGLTTEAVDALKQLVRLEPENPSHRQRLQSLGVSVEEISSAPTGPFSSSRRGAAGDVDPAVMRDISDAERMARAGDNTSAILILEQVLERAPDTVDAREHLRQLYTAERMEDRAAEQCRELARLYKANGDFSRSREMEELADALAPARGFGFEAQSPLGRPAFELDFGDTTVSSEPQPSSFDLSSDFSYGDQGQAEGSGFDLFGTAEPEPIAQTSAPSSGADSGPIMSDAALRDELEGVDFYIAQGYLEIARDTLDRLAATFPNHPEIERRFQKLKSTAELKAQMERIGSPETGDQADAADEPAAEAEFDLSSMFSIETVEPEVEAEAESEVEDPFNIRNVPSPFATSELPNLGEPALDPEELLSESFAVDETELAPEPFDLPVEESGFDISVEVEEGVQAEEAPAETDTGFDVAFAAEPEPAEQEPQPEASGEADLLDVLIDNLDTKFDQMDTQREAAPSGPIPASAAAPPPPAEEAGDSVLQEIFDEFKSSIDEEIGQDFDTHYNLGMAYRDMELLDDAIEEFQSAIRTTSPTEPDGRYVQCCNMLGLCFMAKDMPRLAVMWFRKGLDAPNRPEDEYQALRFDLGLAYERLGEIDTAMDVFSECYAIDINYRDVGEKLKELQALKKGQ